MRDKENQWYTGMIKETTAGTLVKPICWNDTPGGKRQRRRRVLSWAEEMLGRTREHREGEPIVYYAAPNTYIYGLNWEDK